MTSYTKEYTIERQQQGFRSQAHLDAWYAAYDHGKTCPNCQGTDYVELSDGPQPVSVRCQVWKELDRIEARIDR